MNTYCLSCKKDTRNFDPKVVMLSRCAICNNKKSKFTSQGSGLFDRLVFNTTQNRMKDASWNALR